MYCSLEVVTDYWPPFNILGPDGHWRGSSMDLLHAVQAGLGFDFSVAMPPEISRSWYLLHNETAAGNCDLNTAGYLSTFVAMDIVDVAGAVGSVRVSFSVFSANERKKNTQVQQLKMFH